VRPSVHKSALVISTTKIAKKCPYVLPHVDNRISFKNISLCNGAQTNFSLFLTSTLANFTAIFFVLFFFLTVFLSKALTFFNQFFDDKTEMKKGRRKKRGLGTL
jgi:hypothetical protein